MKKKRFYNNKKRNTKWTEKEKGRKISFADKYIEAGTGSDKFDKRRPKPKKKLFTKDKILRFFKGTLIAVLCFFIVSIGYAVMDLYVERNAMPVKDDSNEVQVSFSDIGLKLNCLSVDSLSLDGGVMLEAVINNASNGGYSAVSFDIKRDDGTIGYESKLATIDAYGAISSPSVNLKKTAKLLAENDIMPVARISCYKDNIAPQADLSSAVLSGKSLYRDSTGSAYLNPQSDSAYSYIKGIIEEVKGMGITVFVLDNVDLPEEVIVDGQGFEALKRKLYIDFGGDIKFMSASHIDLSLTKDMDIEKELSEQLKLEDDTICYITTTNEAAVKKYLEENKISNCCIIIVENDNSSDYDENNDDYDNDNENYSDEDYDSN